MRPTRDVRRADFSTNTMQGEGAPIPTTLGRWYGKQFLRFGWVFEAHYSQLTLQSICTIVIQSSRGLCFYLGATLIRNCACGNIQMRGFPLSDFSVVGIPLP